MGELLRGQAQLLHELRQFLRPDHDRCWCWCCCPDCDGFFGGVRHSFLLTAGGS